MLLEGLVLTGAFPYWILELSKCSTEADEMKEWQ
jgi:hypothetical protein